MNANAVRRNGLGFRGCMTLRGTLSNPCRAVTTNKACRNFGLAPVELPAIPS